MTPLPWAVRPLPAEDAARIDAVAATTKFSAPWVSTVNLLTRELTYLRAEHVVLEIEDLLERSVPRTDVISSGVLASIATVGARVRLSFDSRHGPLSYACGRFGADAGTIAWKHNVRAIALGLEALRRVDRYGIARGGEQYSGWLQLPEGEPAHSAGVLLTLAGVAGVTATQVVADPATFRRVYQAAARRHDPDAGGDVAAWARLQRARTVLLDHHGASA